MKPTKGFRRSSRSKLKSALRAKFTVNQFLKEFSDGQSVVIKINPSSHRSMPMPKYSGKTGVIKRRDGRAYRVLIMDGNKQKELLVAPEHLKEA